jgi:hypothetical protein
MRRDVEEWVVFIYMRFSFVKIRFKASYFVYMGRGEERYEIIGDTAN